MNGKVPILVEESEGSQLTWRASELDRGCRVTLLDLDAKGHKNPSAAEANEQRSGMNNPREALKDKHIPLLHTSILHV